MVSNGCEAVRVDDAGGFEERVSFVGSPGAAIFSCLHRPLGGATSGLLICSPLFADSSTNYTREVWLSRELARRGVAVQRFHYRCTGNSDGSVTDLTFGSMLEDARRMLDHLVEASTPDALATLGTRLSTSVAATVLRTSGVVGSVLLWEPTLDHDRYFRDAVRFANMSSASKREKATSTRDMRTQLDAEGWVDVLGDVVPRDIHDGPGSSAWRHDLVASAHHVLVAQFAKGNAKAQYQALCDDLVRDDVAAELRVCGFDEPWWFVTPVPRGRAAVDTSVAWAERTGLARREGATG